MADQKKGSGSRKHGRNKAKCTTYAVNHRRERNKARAIVTRARGWKTPGTSLARVLDNGGVSATLAPYVRVEAGKRGVFAS